MGCGVAIVERSATATNQPKHTCNKTAPSNFLANVKLIQNRIKQQNPGPSRLDGRMLDSIKQLGAGLQDLSDQALSSRFGELRHHHQSESNRSQDSRLVEAFALINESLRRTVSMSAYDVQFLAGLAMARGAIAEMQTGEGKSLTCAFPVVAHALNGKGVHVATVNAYLAERDFEFLKPALELIGLTAGISESGADPEAKRAAYSQDVTFATGYELGFDFLRDQIAMRQQGADRLGSKLRRDLFGDSNQLAVTSQRGFAAAIIDEIDSVFIDEATTPLVLSSGQLGTTVEETVYRNATLVAESLEMDEHFSIDESKKALSLTEAGFELAHELSQDNSNHQLLRPWRLYVESALRAKHVMIRDINYVVRDDKVEIVDEYTGRIFADRNWRDGLHQAVEAKENVPITEERKTIARISRQRYFQRYDVLCGMTGTADGHQSELMECYRLPIVIIPRRKKLARIELPTRYFKSEENKINAIVADVQQRNKTAQPVLIGTRTIDQSLRLSAQLHSQNVDHQVLNGVQDEDESVLIAGAGADGAVTVATNMAGRGTDIKPDPAALEAGGLHVIGFERNSSIRIDRQLLGRAGRQGDPGSGQFFVSAEDDIVVRHDRGLTKSLRRISSADGVASKDFDRRVRRIQQVAEKVGYQSRREVMREELWLDKVKKAAG
jgi:preprotein translocase subunit SecA